MEPAIEMESKGNPPPYSDPPPHPPPPAASGPAIIIAQAMGPEPQNTTCVSCNAQIVTRVSNTTTAMTHIAALILCVFGCWPCCLIPYCMDSCQSTDHNCPNCGAYLGSYRQ